MCQTFFLFQKVVSMSVHILKNGMFCDTIKSIFERTWGELNKLDLTLIKLESDNADRKCFDQINEEAFPLSERMSFEEIFDFASNTNTDILGIYDGDKPVGFAVLLKNVECGYVYFIAIDQSMRSKGYGGAAIQKLMRVYPELQLVLDFEVIDENAENNEQRLRRKNFYLRNGFHETGNYTMLRNERFEVVCSGGELNKTALKDLLSILHKHRPEFPDVLI